ncbi:hypothetical protein [Hymenobacter cellulosivorans]|uniref:Uncharacterized protein n=1 Tax=Hymenobacter cellulosivorans TaxID=2932249 RepID=A0ABY4FAR3_9BACT|nr:hypothetical protein [Hymenobacter cellulosivorans]UOQ53584.1 hypothetical protein MUN80_02225 [Hymenobacter cellulosivorans]
MEELASPAAEPELPTTPEARAAYIKAAQTKPDLVALSRLFAAELRAHPALQEALAPYLAQSKASVVSLYANAKAAAFIKGPFLAKQAGARFIEIREEAAHDLWEIQQKKLFDLQCRWRAEQITLPGVRHTEEFRQWEKYIDYCPWLPPITADEVALYESYLRSDYYVPNQNWSWQNYDRFRRAAEGNDLAPDEADDPNDDGYEAASKRAYRTLPAWYQYHNEATGQNLLLTLPDVRGEKEAYYINLTEADKAEKLAAQRARGDMAASLPWHPLILHHNDLSPYFRQFEDPADLPRLLRWYEASGQDDRRRHGYLFEATHWIEQALEHQTPPWPIAAHADWRQAVIAAGMRAWGHQLAEVLTDVWQEQEQNRALGLPLTGPKEYGDRAPFAEVNWAEEESYRPKFILRGRELAGESRDFNF